MFVIIILGHILKLFQTIYYFQLQAGKLLENVVRILDKNVFYPLADCLLFKVGRNSVQWT
jgi:hypothetical protein